MAKLIVVTGAAGFIGSNTVAALNARGMNNLLLVDVLGHDDKWKNLLGLRYEDMLSPDQFAVRLAQDHDPLPVQAVIHLGACSSTTERNADYLLHNNYQTTRAICEWCLKHHARFIYASSAATYGDGSLGYKDDDATTERLKPLNMYGYSKQMFDLWALQSGLFDRIVGLKYFNVFGPREEHKGDMRSLVHKAFHQINETGQLSLFKSHRDDYADGEQKRDFVYVKDAVDVTLHFLDSAAGGLFNCGTGEASTWKDLAQAVFTAMDRPVNIRYIDMPEALRGKYQYFTQADVSKLRRAGYTKAFTPLEEAVRETVQNRLMVL